MRLLYSIVRALFVTALVICFLYLDAREAKGRVLKQTHKHKTGYYSPGNVNDHFPFGSPGGGTYIPLLQPTSTTTPDDTPCCCTTVQIVSPVPFDAFTKNIPVIGISNKSGASVTLQLRDGKGNLVQTVMSGTDKNGNWGGAFNGVASGMNYSITAIIGSGSDTVTGITVINAPVPCNP